MARTGVRYHVNNEGEPGVCKAETSCPFGDLESDHYPTKEAAREGYEKLMTDTNTATLVTYSNTAQPYIDSSPTVVQGFLKEWVDRFADQLPEGARIVELGSGGGRDAAYLTDRGFDVVATDAIDEFVEVLEERRLNTLKIDALKDNLPKSDAYFANAVMLHFNNEETDEVLRKVHDALPEDGKFAFTVKEGKGEEWNTEKVGAPRYFNYWNTEDLTNALNRAGFDQVEFDSDQVGSTTWIHAIASKTPVIEDYQMGHQPDSDGAQSHDLESHFPDIYDHPEWYRTGDTVSDKESLRVIQAVRGNPDAEVTIYRAVPQESYGIKSGNWVSLSENYAKNHGMSSDDSDADWPVVSMKVRASEVRSPGDSINEFGYFPEG